jgi:hypothetical protein
MAAKPSAPEIAPVTAIFFMFVAFIVHCLLLQLGVA